MSAAGSGLPSRGPTRAQSPKANRGRAATGSGAARTGPVAQAARCGAKALAQQSGQRGGIVVADASGDGLCGKVRGAQQVTCLFQADGLGEAHRRYAHGLVYKTLQGSFARPDGSRRVRNAQRLVDVCAHPSFEGAHGGIGPGKVTWNGVAGLSWTVVHHQVSGSEVSKSRARLPYESESQVEMCHGGAGRRHSDGIDQHASLVQRHLGVRLTESAGQPPTRGGAQTIQDAGLSKKERAGTGGSQRDTFSTGTPELLAFGFTLRGAYPVHQKRGLSGTGPGDDKEIGLRYVVEGLALDDVSDGRTDGTMSADTADLPARRRVRHLSSQLVGHPEHIHNRGESGVEKAIQDQHGNVHVGNSKALGGSATDLGDLGARTVITSTGHAASDTSDRSLLRRQLRIEERFMSNDSLPPATRLGLLVRIEARSEYTHEVEELLTGALALAQEETGTTVWFALRLGPTTFGIFDAFATEEDRGAHLQGKIAAALMENAPKFLVEAPEILPVDIIAAKLS